MRYLGRNGAEKSPGLPEMFSAPVVRDGTQRRGGMKKEEQKYRTTNKRVLKALKKAKEDWMDTQCKEIDACLNKNNRKEESQLVEDTTSEK